MMEKIKAGEITGQTGDYMLRATAANGQIRAFAATSRDLVEKARQAHNTRAAAAWIRVCRRQTAHYGTVPDPA